ncbi:NAD(P)-linked oxidoreductase superfamily protein [Striga asiatica]|uniref:NAD(P)-linked oxidoreductase superfamily protein n=1 Tax=Striga asiatica TaxID=4170 RepID=A0A5A7PUV9_STRAF|nr:NAD(P)-linked oxidoreductase superfamily protein [Striga asiatica]
MASVDNLAALDHFNENGDLIDDKNSTITMKTTPPPPLSSPPIALPHPPPMPRWLARISTSNPAHISQRPNSVTTPQPGRTTIAETEQQTASGPNRQPSAHRTCNRPRVEPTTVRGPNLEPSAVGTEWNHTRAEHGSYITDGPLGSPYHSRAEQPSPRPRTEFVTTTKKWTEHLYSFFETE